ncbi:GNAT family N-acetyltransferase [Pseudoalteromonas fenneropenaei]|uniref:GNAT family N-acetyltransferase n=1 Tax=Pseudoalteromonas fenneropenaei TaxID=1737459 RepID=A0ABV7CHE7_9GAMM
MQLTNSARLSYRLMDELDGELLFELDQDPAVMRFLNGGVPTSMADINNLFIPRMMSYRNQAQGWGLWQCNKLDDGQFIGWILVRPMYFFGDNRDDQDLELGWRFKQIAWGKGYATEAAQHIANCLPQYNDLNALSAIAVEDNLGSISVMKKLGMQFVKKAHHQDPLWQAEVVYYRVLLSTQNK